MLRLRAGRPRVDRRFRSKDREMQAEQVEVRIAEDSIELTNLRVVTGVVFLDSGLVKFPEPDWNDYIVVILGWWLVALRNIVEGRMERVELRFMDGPFWVLIRKLADDDCEVQCMKGDDEVFRCRYSPMMLLRATYKAAAQVQRVCFQREWESEEITTLSTLIGEVRQLMREN
jgi:hypothetical protein